MSNNPSNQTQQPPTKEQEALAEFNNALALIQASGTTLNNVVKSLQQGANAMLAGNKEKDAKIAELTARVKDLEALVPAELKKKEAEPKK
jgi:hypothetical protein